MIWPDIVIGVGQFIFAAATLPAILGEQKPPFSMSLITALTLYAFGAAYWHLGLYTALAAVLVCGTCWAILAWQVGAGTVLVLFAAWLDHD